MIRVVESICLLPYYRPVPLTNLPLLYHREHLFPYTSYDGTEAQPVPRAFRLVILENDCLRVAIVPDVGGRVYSLFDKRIGREILYSNPVVKPVRILPIWAFLAGGIEFNFPISHSPTGITTIGCASGQIGDYAYVRVGEREARTGMEWVVELGLCEGSPVLVQRTALRNQTGSDHPWMMWTNCGVASTPQTEFVYPAGRALCHDEKLGVVDWPGDGLNWERNLRQMTGFFWKPGSGNFFGVFHHDRGYGLLHVAAPDQVPGKKLWSYGHGTDRRWALAATDGTETYAEIQSGPLEDQAQKPLFPAGGEMRFVEYWIPVHDRAAFAEPQVPQLSLPAWDEPWLGWRHSMWQMEWETFRAGSGPIPSSVVPTGLEMEAALRRAGAAEPLALWLAFRGRAKEALAVVEHCDQPTARRVAGLVLWKGLNQPERAVKFLESGSLEDPVAVTELDELYAALGLTAQRQVLLARAPAHRLVLERRAQLALTLGQVSEAQRLLQETMWPLEHQRYLRGDLWRKATGEQSVPEFLGEDRLARFGAYWAD